MSDEELDALVSTKPVTHCPTCGQRRGEVERLRAQFKSVDSCIWHKQLTYDEQLQNIEVYVSEALEQINE